jgi:hypothetical protein
MIVDASGIYVWFSWGSVASPTFVGLVGGGGDFAPHSQCRSQRTMLCLIVLLIEALVFRC